ncbi:hypothetical protein vBAfQDWS535_52 [Alcaligenes phage vB_Af_QDWS535]|nr:hypothetical protein vBAfQDWS535_52 [Alcaligenes phage vB_Af_QDWS535]
MFELLGLYMVAGAVPVFLWVIICFTMYKMFEYICSVVPKRWEYLAAGSLFAVFISWVIGSFVSIVVNMQDWFNYFILSVKG